MSQLLRIYWIFFKTSLAIHFQYRVAMFIWLIGMIIEPVMYLVVWEAVASGRGGEVGGFTRQQFAAYYIVLMVVNHLTFTWVMWEYEYSIREGVFAGHLLRPIHPIHRDAAENLAYKLMTSSAVIPTALGLSWFFRPDFAADAFSIALFPLVLGLAILLRFLVEWTLALAAFWTTRTTAINSAYFAVLLFLCGRVAPIELLPAAARTLAYLTPFPWMVAFPVEVLVKGATPSGALQGILMQGIWCVISIIFLGRAYRAALRRFVAVGS